MSAVIDVSVIIPTYNRASFLTKCIRSVLNSGVARVETIVVDDGSSDNTAAVVQSLGPDVRYERQSNRGPAAARNLGFSVSRGRYVTFLDSDDEWIPGAAPQVIDLLDRHPEVPLVFADAAQGNPADGFRSFIVTYGGSEFQRIRSTEIEPGVRRLDRHEFLARLVRRNVMFLGSLVMRREIFRDSGGFDPGLCGAADWELFLRLASAHECVSWPDVSMSRYITHPAAMSRDNDHMGEEFIRALVKAMQKAPLAADERRMFEDEVRRHSFGWAYQAYDRGDLPAARARFGRCVRRSGPAMRPLMYLAASCLPAAALRRARACKQQWIG